MSIVDHTLGGYSANFKARIVTVDPSARAIHAVLKDGKVRPLSLWDIPNGFRWPQVGEWWTVCNQNNQWYLGHRWAEDDDAVRVEDLSPGEAIGPPIVRVGPDTLASRSYTTLVGNGIDTEYLIAHNLDSIHVTVTSRPGSSTRLLLSTLEAGATTLEADISDYPSSGRIAIENEIISYGSHTSDHLNGLTRGLLGSADVNHARGTSFHLEVAPITLTGWKILGPDHVSVQFASAPNVNSCYVSVIS